jgi:uncharacterized protein
MIQGLEDKMRDRVLRESEGVAREEWADFLEKLDVPFHNYRGTHVMEVVRVAKHLAKETSADYDVVVMAAWFHDVSKPSTTGGDYVHGDESAEIARDFLLKEGLNQNTVERVCDAIRKHMGYTQSEPVEPLEAQIIWEADKLTKLGIICHLQNLMNGLRYEPNLDMDGMLARMKYVMPLMREIVASMSTEPGKRIANDRIRNAELFIEMFESELNLER